MTPTWDVFGFCFIDFSERCDRCFSKQDICPSFYLNYVIGCLGYLRFTYEACGFNWAGRTRRVERQCWDECEMGDRGVTDRGHCLPGHHVSQTHASAWTHRHNWDRWETERETSKRHFSLLIDVILVLYLNDLNTVQASISVKISYLP